MHSSRVRTVHCTNHLLGGGVCPGGGVCQTPHSSENIIFPQLRLRTVIKYQEFCHRFISLFPAPTDHLLLSNRSHAYAALDQYQNALKDAELAIHLQPDWPKVDICLFSLMFFDVDFSFAWCEWSPYTEEHIQGSHSDWKTWTK